MNKPKKVLPATLKHQLKTGYKHICPTCGNAVGYIEVKFFRKVLYEQCCQYCTMCGQKLDWSDTYDNQKN